MSALWLSAPDTVEDSSASRTPPLIDIVETRVPASLSFNDPAVTVIPPERLLPDAIDTGVILLTERDVTVESASTSKPKLSDVVLTLSTVIEFRRSLLLALSRVSPPLTRLPPPLMVSLFAPRASPPDWLRVRVYPCDTISSESAVILNVPPRTWLSLALNLPPASAMSPIYCPSPDVFNTPPLWRFNWPASVLFAAKER